VRALSNGKESDLRALMADLPREPSEPSIMASLVAMLSGEAGRSDEERSEKILGNAAYMLHLGWQDLSGLAAWLVVECARRPELLQAVRTDPDTAARVVDETLRLHQSEYLYRKANADIRVADFVIPKGWLIRLCVREAHRSEAHFREPDSFDAGRFEDGCPYGRPSPDRFQPFGVDHHRCIGNDLTYKIGRLLVEELAHYQLRVVREASDSVGTRHWRHVTPGRRMRLQLSSSPESNR
jgi:cytochrome P450